ncbi:ABC transporter C family member 13-like protein [Trifolium pratense]|uniref:ABC transporter C family member 13-like protein n=1 Tax=Trifolium pratense TaxID=57577 RepID=A0A2K3NYA4_TRIPR|nr:ABC transporter C family member 13-like protein [Trifolium pratense]
MATVLDFAVNIVTIVMIAVLGFKQKIDCREAQRSFTQVSVCIMESLVVLLNISFGIVINVIRIKRSSSKSSLLEDPLLSNGGDLEEGGNDDLGNNGNFLDFMTFKFISPVMNQGVLKQLDSDDLLPLLPDMSPSYCHDIILSSWRAQMSNNGSSPSLFRALCNAYGLPYLCLGLLKKLNGLSLQFNGVDTLTVELFTLCSLVEKTGLFQMIFSPYPVFVYIDLPFVKTTKYLKFFQVINDGIGFAGPLLLNKLIKFLQQGSASWDGYLLALSLGIASIVKLHILFVYLLLLLWMVYPALYQTKDLWTNIFMGGD